MGLKSRRCAIELKKRYCYKPDKLNNLIYSAMNSSQPTLLNPRKPLLEKKLIYDIKCVGCKISEKILMSHIVETCWLSFETVLRIIT